MEERFKIGARVDGTDGEAGELVRIVIDPVKQALTHLVVAPAHHPGLGHLVPVDLVDSVDGDRVKLNCTAAHVGELDDAQEARFLSGDHDNLGYDHHSVLLWPYRLGRPMTLPRYSEHAPMFEDRVPLGDVEMHRGDPVRASDGRIGAVEGVVVNPDDHQVTHVLLQEGHVWGHKHVAIPIGATACIGEEVHVKLTMQEIEDLPPVQLDAGK